MRENRTFGSVRGRRRNPILSTRLAPWHAVHGLSLEDIV